MKFQVVKPTPIAKKQAPFTQFPKLQTYTTSRKENSEPSPTHAHTPFPQNAMTTKVSAIDSVSPSYFPFPPDFGSIAQPESIEGSGTAILSAHSVPPHFRQTLCAPFKPLRGMAPRDDEIVM